MNNASNFYAPVWSRPNCIQALVTTRDGGVSLAPYDQFNLGLNAGDNPDSVMENRRILRLSLPSEPVWLKQVHGIEISTPMSRVVDSEGPYQADASVTNQANEVLAILTADCMPVLFTSYEGDVIGAAHAGWRGLSGGVLESTIHEMCKLKPGLTAKGISAWMGPAIGPSAFEVGEDVYQAFSEQSSHAISTGFKPILGNSGKYLADLYVLAADRLKSLGLGDIQGGGFCTFEDKANFYSYRRDGVTGRFASLIWISPNR